MIERNLGNATDKQIKADQSLAKADYINMWHLPPLADPGPRRLYLGEVIYFPRKSSMLVRLRHPESQKMMSLGKTSKDGTEIVFSDGYLEVWLLGEWWIPASYLLQLDLLDRLFFLSSSPSSVISFNTWVSKHGVVKEEKNSWIVEYNIKRMIR